MRAGLVSVANGDNRERGELMPETERSEGRVVFRRKISHFSVPTTQKAVTNEKPQIFARVIIRRHLARNCEKQPPRDPLGLQRRMNRNDPECSCFLPPGAGGD